MYIHHAAHASHGMLRLVIADECVPYWDTLAKYAAAFLGCHGLRYSHKSVLIKY